MNKEFEGAKCCGNIEEEAGGGGDLSLRLGGVGVFGVS